MQPLLTLGYKQPPIQSCVRCSGWRQLAGLLHAAQTPSLQTTQRPWTAADSRSRKLKGYDMITKGWKRIKVEDK